MSEHILDRSMWAGIDDNLQEKQEDGRVFDAASGIWLFDVPPEYRESIVRDHNAYATNRDALNEQLANTLSTRAEREMEMIAEIEREHRDTVDVLVEALKAMSCTCPNPDGTWPHDAQNADCNRAIAELALAALALVRESQK